MLSCTAMTASFFCSVKLLRAGNSVDKDEVHTILWGIHPKLRKKGAKPVDSDLVELIANSMAGSLDTQSF